MKIVSTSIFDLTLDFWLHNLKTTKSQRQLTSVLDINLTLTLDVGFTLDFGHPTSQPKYNQISMSYDVVCLFCACWEQLSRILLRLPQLLAVRQKRFCAPGKRNARGRQKLQKLEVLKKLAAKVDAEPTQDALTAFGNQVLLEMRLIQDPGYLARFMGVGTIVSGWDRTHPLLKTNDIGY